VVVVLAAIVLAVLALAYSNGANDNFKGVATLFGSGTATYRNALAWATVTTLAGSLLALLLADGLVESFRGRGLVAYDVTVQPAFVLPVILGAAMTILCATRIGLPVSTTHALIGGLIGAGLMAAGGEVQLLALGKSFIIPLLFSPVIAIALTILIYPFFRWARRVSGISSRSCICIAAVFEEVTTQNDGTLLLVRTGASIRVGQATECYERYQGRVLGIETGPVLDSLHFLSAGAVGFARGLNDTPKIVALLLVAPALNPNLGLALVAVVMALGGLLNARRVADTLSRKITRMSPGQGFTANLITASLVIAASRWGLPVSTTHVAVGSLFGIGAVNRKANVTIILTILLAWVTTLPMAAILAAAIHVAQRALPVSPS
jgi:PiT family inorganic phosphate transporter